MDKVKLEMKINGTDIFEAMKNSGYMKKRGYKILYAKSLYEDIKYNKTVKGVKLERTKKGKLIEHRLCYAHFDELIYLHILSLKPELISEFSYLVACGDENKAESDLANLVQEVKKNLSGK